MIVDDEESTYPTGSENVPLITNSNNNKGESSSSTTATTSNSKYGTTTDHRNDITEVDKDNQSLLHDMTDTVWLGIPIFFSSLSWVGMKTTDSALLGHVSTDALAAASLSDLWTMCTGVLIQGRVLSVLCGSAIGAGNPKLAGIYLQVSYFVLSGVCVLVFITWCFTKHVWLLFGTDPKIASMAGYYATVLAFSLPGNMFFSQISQFFMAQRIMHPEVTASSVALIANLVLGLFFVLGFPLNGFSGYGFTACPIVTTSLVYVQLIIVVYFYMYKQRLHEKCWDGWSLKDITKERIQTFIDLYVPAALGLASDFWRVGVVGMVAAKLGGTEVAVFNSSYRIMWIILIVVNSLSSAAGIKMSTRLGSMDHVGAKQAGYVGIFMSAFVLALVGFTVTWKIRMFGRIFSNDESFLTLFEEAKWPFTITLMLMNLSVAIEKIPYSMGRTTEVFWFGLIASWAAQVPAVILLTKYWRNDLFGLYTGMCIGYFTLAVLYGSIVVTSDWKKYAEIAQTRSETFTTNKK